MVDNKLPSEIPDQKDQGQESSQPGPMPLAGDVNGPEQQRPDGHVLPPGQPEPGEPHAAGPQAAPDGAGALHTGVGTVQFVQDDQVNREENLVSMCNSWKMDQYCGCTTSSIHPSS